MSDPKQIPKIVFFHAHDPNSIGGNTTYFLNTVKYLSRRLQRLDVLLPEGGLQLEGTSLSVHYYSMKKLKLPVGIRYFYFLARFIQLYTNSQKLLRRLQPDVVISNNSMVMLVAYVATRRAVRIFLPGTLSVMDMRMDVPAEIKNFFKRWLHKLNPWGIILLEKMALRVADKIVVNTMFLQELIAEIYGKKYTKYIVIIPNGVDIERYSVKPESKRNGEKYIVLSAFRLMRSKNWHLILEACAFLKPGIEWWIAGDGPDLQELENAIINCGLENTVKVLGARDDMAELYRQADIFVHLSRYDNYPTVVLEASVTGLPIVLLDPNAPGTYTGYAELMNRIPECVTVMDTGESVAKAINKLVTSLPGRLKIATESRKLNNHERHVDALMSLIRDELGQMRI
jgi:glycosyltransferase involved in cell wall biosynthesis